MINIDEEAFICDMAETYHIYDYKSLPLHMVGIFACGLRQNSRIAMKISGAKFSLEQIVLAAIADGTRMTAWLNSMNGEKGIKKPTSLVEILLGNETDEESIIETFDSGQDFNDEWIRMTRGEK